MLKCMHSADEFGTGPCGNHPARLRRSLYRSGSRSGISGRSRPNGALLFLALLWPVVICGASPGKSSLDAILDDLFAMREVREVAISPDGRRLAWVEMQHNPDGKPSLDSGVYVANVPPAASKPLRVTARIPAGSYADVSWSPDSRQLAFLADAGGAGQYQVYIANAAGGANRRLTALKGSLATPRWSPDGKTIALRFTENAPRKPGPAAPMLPSIGVIGGATYAQRLATVDVVSERLRQLSPEGLNVYEYDWSPDGKKFAAIAATGQADNNWYVAKLYIIDAGSGKATSLHQPATQIAGPRWSPDGDRVAFIGGLMSDEDRIGGDIYVVPASGGEARNITPGLQGSANWLTWTGTDEILLARNLDGGISIASLRVSKGEVTPLWSGPETISVLPSGGTRNLAISLASDGRTSAAIRESTSRPPDVWAGPIGAWEQVTHGNRNARPGWGKIESIHWKNEGLDIQGWLTYPAEYDAARKYPLVVQVHGGPSLMARPRWPLTMFDFTLLSLEGYFVLQPNPRGSYGQGEAFTRANVKDFGHGDLRDILAGIDYVVEHFPVDDHRVGLGGWSYGGFMAMWATTQTNRFRATVAGAGIANWQSYYGQTEIPEWMIPFFGRSPYDDPAVYAKSSPINFIKNARTPALILVGERDGRVSTAPIVRVLACPPDVQRGQRACGLSE